MKIAVALVGALFLLVGASSASGLPPLKPLAGGCGTAIVSTGPAKRGCCSYHSGVCGCNGSTGMQRCCDGSDSPSCQCGE